MRNLMLLAAALFFAGQSFAQQGIEFTVGYTPGVSFILNDDDFAEGRDLNYQTTYGSHVGLTVGYNFTDFVGVATGFGLANINQNYISDYENIDREDQNTFRRSLSYIRIPLMLRVGGDNTRGTSAYFRVGPHIDLLTTATGETNINLLNINTEQNFRDGDDNVFENMVIGVTMEIGGRIRISDAVGILLAFHLESSLTNPEGEDARFLFSNSGSNPLDPERAGSWNIMPGLNVSFQYVLSL